MGEPYEEIVEGEVLLRAAPEERHERITGRLASALETLIHEASPPLHLNRRSVLQLTPGTLVRPDLCLIESRSHNPVLIVEVVSPRDHRVDTVIKKEIYEQCRIPALWMVDPRYDNMEVYAIHDYGLALNRICAGKDTVTTQLLPSFTLVVESLFS